MAEEELSEGYELSDATIDLGALALADVAAAQANAQAVVDGAANASELTLDATYSLTETAFAADAVTSDVAGLADAQAAAEAGVLTEAQQTIVDGASNAADVTIAVPYILEDTLANLQAADAAVLDGAESYGLTETAFTAETAVTSDVAGLADAQAAAEADVLTEAQQAIVDGASNAADVTIEVPYILEDTLANLQAADAAVLEGAASYSVADAADTLANATSVPEITLLAGADVINVTGDATVAQMNTLLNESQYSNIGSYALNDTVENLLAGGDILANADAAAVSGEPMLTVAQYNEIAAVATVETYTVEDTAEAILEAGADAAALTGAASVAITDEIVTLEQAVALDTLDLGVAYPAVDVSLEAAAAAETLPANYALTADVFAAGEVTVEAATTAFAGVSAIVAGAANADELAVTDLFTWSIADTLENIDAADADVIEGADAYTLTNEAGELGELTGDEYETVLGAANADDYTFTVVPSPITDIAAQGPVVEGSDVEFTVEMDYAVNVDRTIDYQINGVETGTAGEASPLDDLGQITGTVTIPAGETSGTFTLTPVQDGVTEGREAFTVSLLNEDGTEVVTTSNTVVIEDEANAGQNITLTTGIDEPEGGAGNDTFRGLIDTTTGTGNVSTLNDLDSIDGLGGTDTLRLNVQGDGTALTSSNFPGADISNVENLLLRSGENVNLDLTTDANWQGLELVNVARADGTLALTAADTTDFNVSGTGDSVTLNGGQNVVVNDDNAGSNISIGVATVNNGTIDVTDTDQGTGTITIDGGTDVTVNATDVGIGTIDIGTGSDAGDQPSGDVVVNATGADYDDTGSAFQMGTITVEGGTSVTVDQAAYGDTADATTDTSTVTDRTQSDVVVTSDGNTTDVTVNQDSARTAVDAVEAVETVFETREVTFSALDAGESATVDSLTFTASEDLTAEQVAAAFSGLEASDTQDAGGPVANGVYTGNLSGNWSSDAANGADVVFTEEVAGSGSSFTVSGTGVTEEQLEAGATGMAAVDGVAGIINGDVTINDDATASIENIAIDGYATATLGGSQSLDALQTLSLANSTGSATVTSTSVDLDVTVDNVNDAVALGTSTTDLTLNSEGESSTFALTASGTENLAVNAAADLDISSASSNLGSNTLETVEITGAGSVDLGDEASSTALNSFNASANTGGVDATIATTGITGDLTEYVFSQGNDTVTLGATVDTAVSLGAGNDTVNVAGSTLGAMVDGGEGNDTLSMSAEDAATASAGTGFQQNIQNFERLSLGQASADRTVDLANMDDINYVRTAGTNSLTPAVYTINLTNLVLNDAGDTLTIDTITAFTADGAETASSVASGIDGSTITLQDGVTYDINAADPAAVTLTAQTAADTTGSISVSANDDASEGGITQPTTTSTAPSTNGVEDVLTLDNLAADATVELTASGSVEAVLEDAAGGSDVLNVVTSATGNLGVLTANDVETINIGGESTYVGSTAATGTLTLEADSAETVTIGARDTVVDSDGDFVGYRGFTLELGASTTSVELVDASTSLGVVTADASVDGMTLVGGAAADQLTASAANVTVEGGAGDDNITVTGDANAASVTGGEGADTFNMTGATLGLEAYATITDANAGDQIEINGSTFLSDGVTVTDPSSLTLSDWFNAAIQQTDAGEAIWFQHTNGSGETNTFIVDNAGTNGFDEASDVVVRMTGEFDLSTASFNDSGIVEIA